MKLKNAYLIVGLLLSGLVLNWFSVMAATLPMVDDFEQATLPTGSDTTGTPGGGSAVGWAPFSDGTLPTLSLSTVATSTTLARPGQGASNTILKIDFTNAGNYRGFTHAFENASANAWVSQDWSSPTYTGISFWLYGTGSGNTIAFEVFDTRYGPGDTAERWTSPVIDNTAGWRQVFLPFSSFVVGGYNPSGTDGIFQRTAVWAWALNLPASTATIYLDDVSLYSGAVPTATPSGPTATPPAPTPTPISTGPFSYNFVKLNATSAKISFTPTNAMQWVILHYAVNNGQQQNINMTNNAGTWEYTITGLVDGQSIDYSFTYFNGSAAADSSSYNASFGTPPTPAPQPFTQSFTTVNSTSAKVLFTPNNTMQWVIIHFSINNGQQQNVNMTNNAGTWEYTITGLVSGDSVKYNFTYFDGAAAADSIYYTTPFGGSPAATATPSGPTATPTTAGPTATAPAAASAGVDDFEIATLASGVDSAGGATIGWAAFSNGPQPALTLLTVATSTTLARPGQGASNTILQVDYTNAGNDYRGFTHAFENTGANLWVSQNWSSYTGISFWLKGANTNANIQFEVLDTRALIPNDSAERWVIQVPDNAGTGWRQVFLPFNSFYPGGYQPNGNDNIFQRTAVWGWALNLPGNSATIYVDDVFLYTAAAPTPTATPSGPTPTPAPSNWVLEWSDEFNGAANTPPSAANWFHDIGHSYVALPGQPGWNWGTGEIAEMTNSTNNVYLDGNGNLAIKPIGSGMNWTSGRIETHRTDFQAPAGGKMAIEGRIQIPNVTGAAAQGYWPAFWTLGAPFRGVYSNWPSIGEIDILENVNGTNTLYGTMHCGVAPGGPCNEFNGIGGNISGANPTLQEAFHVYRMEFDRSVSPEQVRWYLDGVKYHTVNANQVDAITWKNATDHGFFIILNVAIGGGWPGNPTANTVSGVPMLVDYVKVFYDGAAIPTATATPIAPTATATPVVPTATATPISGATATATAIGAATATATPIPATATATPIPATATATPIPATATATMTPVPTASFSQNLSKVTSNSAKISFMPSKAMNWVIVHYTVNKVDQQNIFMTNNGGTWEYTITGLNEGDLIDYFFTYFDGSIAVDSAWLNTPFGTPNPNATATPQPLPFIHSVISISESSAKILFTPTKPKTWVIVHYTINKGQQINLNMTNTTGTWEQLVTGLATGDTIDYFFTYFETSATDSAWYSTKFVGTATPATSTPTVTPTGPTATPTPVAPFSHSVVQGSSSSAKIVFTPNNTMTWVIVHYTVNNINQQNVYMTKNGGTWEQALNGLSDGDSIDYFFTYFNGKEEASSPWYNARFGTASTPQPQAFSHAVVTVSDSSGKIVFIHTKTMQWVIVHYTINNGIQQNLYMTNSNGTWEQLVPQLSAGDTLDYFFTYFDTMAVDSPWYSAKFGTTPTPTPTPTGGPTPSPSNWRLEWSDDFSGTANTAPSANNWLYDLGHNYPGGANNWGTGEIEEMTNSLDNVYLDGNGNLVIKPIKSGTNWTSGRIETQRLDFQAQKGDKMAIEGRIQLPNVTGAAAQGYWPAFWTLGAPFRGIYTNWPSVGEIDIMESVNGTNTAYAALHCGYAPGGPCKEFNGLGGNISGSNPTLQAAFHTYRMELDRSVSPEQIRWYLDGIQFHSVSASQMDAITWDKATNHGFFIILNVAIGGNWPGLPTVNTASGMPMLVDYVKVYYADATTTVDLIPTTGGSLASSDKMATVQFPNGVLTQSTNLSITILTKTTHLTTGFKIGSNVYRIIATNSQGQHVTQFNQPFTIDFNYQDSDWVGLGDESAISLYYWSTTENRWINTMPCTGCSHNLVNNRFTIQLDHLTDFALLIAESKSKPTYLPMIVR